MKIPRIAQSNGLWKRRKVSKITKKQEDDYIQTFWKYEARADGAV